VRITEVGRCVSTLMIHITVAPLWYMYREFEEFEDNLSRCTCEWFIHRSVGFSKKLNCGTQTLADETVARRTAIIQERDIISEIPKNLNPQFHFLNSIRIRSFRIHYSPWMTALPSNDLVRFQSPLDS